MKLPTKEDFTSAEQRVGLRKWLEQRIEQAVWDCVGSGLDYVWMPLGYRAATYAVKHLNENPISGYRIRLWVIGTPGVVGENVSVRASVVKGIHVSWHELMEIKDVPVS